MISTRDLSQLPEIDRLRQLLQSMAMLDAILCHHWQYRYWSFNSHWSQGEQMGSMRDGCGDDLFVLFNAHGCFIKGFAHESPMSPYRCKPNQLWPGMFDLVPAEFDSCLQQPAFSMADTTFCIWRRYSDPSWQRGNIDFPAGPDPDGSAGLLALLDGKPESYCAWAESYFEKSFLTVEMIRPIYAYQPLTDAMVAALSSGQGDNEDEGVQLEMADLEEDIIEIGYPQS